MCDTGESEVGGKRRSRAFSACAYIVAIPFVLLILWVASGFIFWNSCTIVLPDGTGSVRYMAQVNKIAQSTRKIRFETNRFKGLERYVADDPSGGSPVNVYWYPAKNGSGPYLRFRDPIQECLADLGRGVTLLVLRDRGSEGVMGEIESPFPKIGLIDRSQGGVLYVDGNPAHRLPKTVADGPAVFVGRIDYPYNRFVPVSEEPWKPLTLRDTAPPSQEQP